MKKIKRPPCTEQAKTRERKNYLEGVERQKKKIIMKKTDRTDR